jgi:hypothetical protein
MISCTQTLIDKLKSGKFETTCKVEILDSNENLIEEITSSNIDGNISVDKDRDIRRNFTLTLDNYNNKFTPGVNNLIWLDKKFRIYIGVKTAVNTWEYIPQGIFIFNSPKAISKPSVRQVVLNGTDKMAGWRKITTVLTIEAGVNIATAIMAVLNGVESNFNFDNCTEVTPYSMTYQPGTEVKKIVKEMADFITWDVSYNVYGELRFKPHPSNIDQVASVWTYQAEDYTLYAGSEKTIDDSELYNHIFVIGASSKSATVSAEAKDEDPNSPTSIPVIGDRLYVYNNGTADSLITTFELAQARADYELRKRMQYIEKQQIDMVSNFLHEEGDVITLIDPHTETDDKYELLNFNIPLRVGMTTGNAWKVRNFS